MRYHRIRHVLHATTHPNGDDLRKGDGRDTGQLPYHEKSDASVDSSNGREARESSGVAFYVDMSPSDRRKTMSLTGKDTISGIKKRDSEGATAPEARSSDDRLMNMIEQSADLREDRIDRELNTVFKKSGFR